MGKAVVVYKEEVVSFFNELIFELYLSQYFGFVDTAIDYKDKIIDYIEANITNVLTLVTPHKLKHLGSFYFFFKVNQNTTWYIFFEAENNNYIITGIINNHSIWAKYLNVN